MVEDNDVIAALTERPPATLQIVLQYSGAGKLRLNPSESPSEYWAGGRFLRKAQMKNGIWGVGGNHVSSGSRAKGGVCAD
jgi:hypothetical protein